MNIKLETLPHYRIAYVRQVGPYGPDNIQVMDKLKQWARENDLLTESTIILGIPQDNPETTLPENCRYDASIVISSDYQVEHSVDVSELAGGAYVICTIKHTAEDIQRAWNEIVPFIQSNGYQMDHKPIIERYMGDMTSNETCDLCVPVKPL